MSTYINDLGVAWYSEHAKLICTANSIEWEQPTDGVAVTYQNGWVDYDASAYEGVKYWKDGEYVHVVGMMKSGTMTATAFTLPVGYRPAKTLIFRGVCGSNSYGADRIDVNTDGTVLPRNMVNSWVIVKIKFRL